MGGLLAVPLILVLAVCVMALVVWASRRQGGALGLRPGILLPPHARAILLRLFAAVWWIMIIAVLIPGRLCRCPDHLQDRPLASAFVTAGHVRGGTSAAAGSRVAV